MAEAEIISLIIEWYICIYRFNVSAKTIYSNNGTNLRLER